MRRQRRSSPVSSDGDEVSEITSGGEDDFSDGDPDVEFGNLRLVQPIVDHFTDPSGEFIEKLLNPSMPQVLISICNLLDIHSLVNLAKASKKMRHFCLNNAGIHVPINGGELMVWANDHRLRLPGWVLTEENMKKLRNLPVELHLHFMHISGAFGIAQLQALYQFLHTHRVKSIVKIVWEFCNCYNEVIDFINTYEVKKVDAGLENIPEEILERLFRLPLNHLSYEFGHVGEPLIAAALETPISNLLAPKSSVSIEIIRRMLERFLAGGMHMWDVGYNADEHMIRSMFDGFDKLPFYHIGPLNNRRPVVFLKEGMDLAYWLLTANEKVVFARFVNRRAFMKMNPKTLDLPPVLRWKHQAA